MTTAIPLCVWSMAINSGMADDPRLYSCPVGEQERCHRLCEYRDVAMGPRGRHRSYCYFRPDGPGIPRALDEESHL